MSSLAATTHQDSIGHGKKQVLEKAFTDPEARENLEHVGESPELTDEVRDDMKAFFLAHVNAEGTNLTCGQTRASKWNRLKKNGTIRHPPDEDSLNLHVERTNYIAYIANPTSNLQNTPLPLAMVGTSLMGSVDQCTTLCLPYPNGSRLSSTQVRGVVASIVMMTGVSGNSTESDEEY